MDGMMQGMTVQTEQSGREQIALDLLGPGGLLGRLTKQVIEIAVEEKWMLYACDSTSSPRNGEANTRPRYNCGRTRGTSSHCSWTGMSKFFRSSARPMR